MKNMLGFVFNFIIKNVYILTNNSNNIQGFIYVDINNVISLTNTLNSQKSHETEKSWILIVKVRVN